MSSKETHMNYAELTRFWAALALSWLFMTIEFPLVMAFIARLPDPKFNLAAFGVTLSLMMFCESPIFPAISVSNALVKDGSSLTAVRRFSHTLALVMSGILVLVATTPLFSLVVRGILQIDDEIALLVRPALYTIVAVPFAVGYRRFYQGILISSGKSRLVAYGTAVRLATVILCGLVLSGSDLPGASVGSISFAGGMIAEAATSRLMAGKYLRELAARPAPSTVLPTKVIADYYLPLSLTSIILISIHPMLSFFLSRSLFPIESLAVFPVMTGLALMFKSSAFSFQEVSIAAINRSIANDALLKRFCAHVAILMSGTLILIAFTPLADFWFREAGGLSAELLPFTSPGMAILALTPGLAVWSAYQRGYMISTGKARAVSTAGVIEVCSVFMSLFLLIKYSGLVGATAAACAVVLSVFPANFWLIFARRNT